MKNKILVVIIMFLLPISIVCFNKEVKNKEITVYLNYKDKQLELSLDDYLIGVLGAEMPASFNMEALKAQAIASRTYALYNLTNNTIYTNISEQAYFDNEELKARWQDNYQIYYNKIKQAVNDTKDLVITYNNNLIKSYYYAISNGLTEDAKAVFNEEKPYIKVIDSSFDKDVNNYEKTIIIDKKEFCKILDIECNEINITSVNKDQSNRVETIIINNKDYTGIDIRSLLNLRSTDFEIKENNNKIEITTKGYGHGVGMSQYGANYLANNNYSYEDILKYYYQDIEIKKY